MATTTIPAGDGLPEMTFNLAPAVIAGAPFFIGRSVSQLAAECENNHGDPKYVDALLVAGLVGGGMDHKEARGTVDKLRRDPSGSIQALVTMIVHDALS